ncbi:MAG TPA: hypothetical protein VMS94_00105 [Acidobacteriota bacterium]|jgi:hypothetical protein|nr:hypothetical protein [Acidobacteriota bacterium]
MPIPSALVTRFFQLVVNRQLTEAERELERIKQKMHKTEWNRGYFRALYGILLARRSNNNNDSHAFLSKLEFGDKAALHGYRREFLEHVKNRLHGDFDRGFFSAWADCMRVLGKIDTSNIPSAHVSGANNVAMAMPEQASLEDLKDDKNQATMEEFLED